MKSIQDRLSEKMYVITFKNLTSLCICQYSEGRSATLCKIKTVAVNMKAERVPYCMFLFSFFALAVHETKQLFTSDFRNKPEGTFWLSDSCIVYERKKHNIAPSRGPFDITLAIPSINYDKDNNKDVDIDDGDKHETSKGTN